MAQQGSLDGVLQAKGSFYNTDYTPSILFLGDGTYSPDWPTPLTSPAISGDDERNR